MEKGNHQEWMLQRVPGASPDAQSLLKDSAGRSRLTLHSFLNRHTHLFSGHQSAQNFYKHSTFKIPAPGKEIPAAASGTGQQQLRNANRSRAAGRVSSAWEQVMEGGAGMLRLQLALPPEELSALPLLTLTNQ